MIVKTQRKLPILPTLDRDLVKAARQIKKWADDLLRALEAKDQFIIGTDTIKAEHIVAGAVTALKKDPNWPCCFLFHSANQSATTAVALTLAFNSESEDSTPGMHDTAVNNSRIVPNVPGWYQFGFTGAWAVNATGDRLSWFIRNGVTIIGYDTRKPMAGAFGTVHNSSLLYPMNGTTDYMEVQVLQTSGGPLNLLGGQTYSAIFWSFFVKPL